MVSLVNATLLRTFCFLALAAAHLPAQDSRPVPDGRALQLGTTEIGIRRAVAVVQQGPAHRDWSDRPALVVIVAVDQLASWVLRDALPYCGEGGFKRLLREGATFPNCAYRHACSETGPGHATIGTGADATRHGIIGNEWRDPVTGTRVYCCEDSEQKGLGGDGDGRGPKNLLMPTLADQMKCYLGAESKVVTLSWKDRSAIFMAGRGADAALWFSRKNGRLVSTTAYGAELPEWVARFDQEKPADAYYGRVWQRFAGAHAYAGLVDDVSFERVDFNNARTLPAVIDGGKPTLQATFYEHLYESPFANELLLAAAQRAIVECGLGKDGPPDLLCISFSANDAIGHRNGPQSVESRDVTLRTDDLLARLLETLDRQVGVGRYALALTADHGVQPIPELAQAKRLAAGRGPLSKWAGSAVEAALGQQIGVPPAGTKTWVRIAEDGMVYLNRDAVTQAGKDLGTVRKIAAAAASKVRGLSRAYTLDDVLAVDATSDPVVAALRRASHPERSPDLVLVPQPLWLDGTLPASHGTPWPADRSVPLIVAGAGVVPGTVSRAAVSPGAGVVILAALLKIPPPPGAEDALPEVLAPALSDPLR